MTNEKCSKCNGNLKEDRKVQFLVAYPHDRYWTEIQIYRCVNCKIEHIVDSP